MGDREDTVRSQLIQCADNAHAAIGASAKRLIDVGQDMKDEAALLRREARRTKSAPRLRALNDADHAKALEIEGEPTQRMTDLPSELRKP